MATLFTNNLSDQRLWISALSAWLIARMKDMEATSSQQVFTKTNTPAVGVSYQSVFHSDSEAKTDDDTVGSEGILDYGTVDYYKLHIGSLTTGPTNWRT